MLWPESKYCTTGSLERNASRHSRVWQKGNSKGERLFWTSLCVCVIHSAGAIDRLRFRKRNVSFVFRKKGVDVRIHTAPY